MNFREHTVRDTEEVHRVLQEAHQATIWTALPCIISSFNYGNITVECIPAVQGTVTNPDGTQQNVTLPTLVDVPVCFPRGGGYTMTFPIVSGDECLVVLASRCIDAWWSTGQITPPTEDRMHDLSDGFAIVGPFSQSTKINNISQTGAMFRSDDGTLFVELDHTQGIVTIKASKEIVLDAPNTTLTGVLVVGNSGAVNPAVIVDGVVKATGDVTAGTVSHEQHVHSGVQPGTGDTGPPVP